MSFLILYIKVRCNNIGFLLSSSFRFNIFNGRGWYARCYAFNWLWSTWVCPRHACRRRWKLALRGLRGDHTTNSIMENIEESRQYRPDLYIYIFMLLPIHCITCIV